MHPPAFSHPPFPLRGNRLRSTSPRHVAPCPTMTISLQTLSRRAQADIALLQDNASTAAKTLVAAAAAATVSLSSLSALADVPTTLPSTALFDEPGVIQKSNATFFEKACASMQRSNGVSVHFAFVKSIPYGETPQEFATELAGQWNLGKDDVLFVASPKLARAGVYIGESASGKLSMEVATSIAEETFAIPAGEERYGAALLDVSNRLIPVLAGEADPGPPDMTVREAVQTYKTKEETKEGKTKYVAIVGAVLVISFVAPLLQTYWYVKDD